MLQFFSASKCIVKLPPSRPPLKRGRFSPTGEGEISNRFPLGGNKKGGKNNMDKNFI
jgi:hypothetical protein